MTSTATLERWRTLLLPVALVGTAIFFWRPLYDNFALAKISIVWIAAIAILAVTVARWLVDGEVRIPVSRFLLVVGAVLAAMVLATLTSPAKWTSLLGAYPRWTGLLSYAAYGTLAIAAYRHADGPSVERLLRWLVYSGLVVSSYAILQGVGADPFTWTASDVPDVFSTMGNVNFASAFVGMTFPVAIWLLWRATPSNVERGLGLASVVLGAVALVVIGSLQGYIVAAVTTATMGLGIAHDRSPRARRVLGQRAVHIGAVAAGVAVVAAAVAGWERLFSSLGIGFQERVYFYVAGARIFADHPVLGAGLDTYGVVFTRYQPVAHAVRFREAVPDAPHSVPLGMFTDGGILLGLAYLMLVGFVAWRVVQGIGGTSGGPRLLLVAVASVWLGYQLQSLISIDEPPLALIHWLMVGSIVGLVESRKVREWRLPWGPTTTKKGRKIRRKGPLPALARVSLAAVVLIAVAAAWLVTRPVRADLAAARGRGLGTLAVGEPRAVPMSEDAFQRAHELAPHNGTYWFLHAMARSERGDTEGALQAQAEAARRSPGQPVYAANAALFARQLGRTEEAAAWWREAAERDPNNPERLLAAARFHADAGDPEVAEGLARRVLALQPGSSQARDLLVSLDVSDTG